MTGIEPRTSGIGSDRSTNWATTTAYFYITNLFIKYFKWDGWLPKANSLRRYLSLEKIGFMKR